MKLNLLATAVAATLALLMAALPAQAQRRVTPVEPTAPGVPKVKKTPEQEAEEQRSRLQEQLDSKGNIVLVDTVTGLEWVDTTATASRLPRMVYPKISSLTIGVNFFDGLMRAFGQHWGLADASASMGFYNRYFAVIEAGVGQCSDTPDGNNYSYRSPVAPYFKLGGDYNFFYNSNPDYALTAGLRYGLAPSFSYTIDNCTLTSGYWDIEQQFAIPRQRATVGWFEVLLALRVRIAGPVSMGWAVRYHHRLHSSHTDYGYPMYIPGYGKRGSSVGASMSVYFDIFAQRQTDEDSQ